MRFRLLFLLLQGSIFFLISNNSFYEKINCYIYTVGVRYINKIRPNYPDPLEQNTKTNVLAPAGLTYKMEVSKDE